MIGAESVPQGGHAHVWVRQYPVRPENEFSSCAAHIHDQYRLAAEGFTVFGAYEIIFLIRKVGPSACHAAGRLGDLNS